ncbi:MAG: DUF488 domain-containing protein [Candidatus Omnitrophica bacterium]|nr:DUF488 domain-containing protein [Candidatus Omnitrophota bacterium]
MSSLNIPTQFPVFTIGHSTRTQEKFLALLNQHEIDMLVDIRTIPRSRHNPQFNREIFGTFLSNHRITYLHRDGLGGLRKMNKNSLNNALKNRSFRAYADYMGTDGFQRHFTELVQETYTHRPCLMCAELLPWRCHRWLLADAFHLVGIKVTHIVDETHTQPHTPHPHLKTDLFGRMVYQNG